MPTQNNNILNGDICFRKKLTKTIPLALRPLHIYEQTRPDTHGWANILLRVAPPPRVLACADSVLVPLGISPSPPYTYNYHDGNTSIRTSRIHFSRSTNGHAGLFPPLICPLKTRVARQCKLGPGTPFFSHHSPSPFPALPLLPFSSFR